MKRNAIATLVFLCSLAIMLMLASCGGGGGGGGGTLTVTADEAYLGVRTAAYIDVTNAEALVLGAYSGFDAENLIPLSVTRSDFTVNVTRVLSSEINDPFYLSTVFNQITTLVKKDSMVKPLALLDPVEECVNYPSGTLSDTLVESVNGTIGTVSGSIIYDNCDIGDGLILDGKATISASIDLESNDLSLSMTMSPLDYDDGVTPFSLTGTISGTITTNISGFLVSHLGVNVTLEDSFGQTYWLNNYVLDETEEINGVSSAVSGRFYAHDYGFVDFSTLETIFVPYNSSESTYDGLIRFIGSDGSYANLWLGVNQNDYCINVFNSSGVVDLGTCAL